MKLMNYLILASLFGSASFAEAKMPTLNCTGTYYVPLIQMRLSAMGADGPYTVGFSTKNPEGFFISDTGLTQFMRLIYSEESADGVGIYVFSVLEQGSNSANGMSVVVDTQGASLRASRIDLQGYAVRYACEIGSELGPNGAGTLSN